MSSIARVPTVAPPISPFGVHQPAADGVLAPYGGTMIPDRDGSAAPTGVSPSAATIPLALLLAYAELLATLGSAVAVATIVARRRRRVATVPASPRGSTSRDATPRTGP